MTGRLVKVVLGIGVPILVIVIWTVFVSPNAAVALAVAGQVTVAIVFGVIVAVNAALMVLWGK